MQGSSAFSLTLCIRVAILLAFFASVLQTLAVLVSRSSIFSSQQVFESHNAETPTPAIRIRLNAVDATPVRRRAPLLVDNTTSSYHRPDPSSGTMLPDVIARLYDGARPWSSIAEDQGRGGNTGAVNVR